ncbi:MAG: hypothetical protein PHV34_23005 [Verrucomicrobiae bacterium]|nr:hypothetical protein [Verrucomicrobiae bacterium]
MMTGRWSHRVLLEARIRQTARLLRQVFLQSRFMAGLITLFVAGYWIGLTWLLYRGMQFVQESVPALGDLLIYRMLYLMFAFVFGMLAASTVIVGFGVYFRNSETAWLQTLPLSHGQVFRWKTMEAAAMASWAFIFLSGPLLLAHGLALRLSPWFLAGVLVLYIPFSILANALGTMLTLLLVRGWHHRTGRWLLMGAGMALAGWVWCSFKPVDVRSLREAELLPLMNILLQNTRLVVTPLLPSYWLTSGIIGLGDFLWPKTLFFFLLTCSHAALAGWLAMRYGGTEFYRAATLMHDRRQREYARAWRAGWCPVRRGGEVLIRLLFWVERPVRGLLLKDWLTFWRDGAQWSQFAIFFGLLGFYFLNIRNFHYHLNERFWASVVGFLNLASLGLILATLTTRFIFPQFSLEGRRLWLVGLSPVSLNRVIWGKFWASALGCGTITLVLMLISFSSLRLDAGFRWLIGFCVVVMSLGLSGIAVGAGVLFPNFKQQNAAQIVSGFGGAFCLVLSLTYVAATVILAAFPAHWLYVREKGLDFQFASPVSLIYGAVFLAGLAAAGLPMELAKRKLAKFEM